MERKNIYSKTVENWDDLTSSINSTFVDFPNYIFRGQAQSDWLLESTLSRALKKIKYKHKEELVKEHLERFRLAIRGRRGLNPRELKENELWALGQHFGLHTPLLDWTQSPYVALFFALANLKKSATGYRTLWGLHSTDTEEINEFHAKKNPKDSKWKVELINPILDENNRLVNQNGLFTKINVNSDIEKWVTEGPNIEWVTLYRIDFPDGIRDTALGSLDLMNINYSSLFPDLFGSSMDSNSKLEQTDYLVKQQEKVWKE